MATKLLTAAVLMALCGAASAAPAASMATLAMEHAQAHRAELRAAPGDRFTVRSSSVDSLTGNTVARLERSYAGLPVIGGDVVEFFRGEQFLGSRQTLASSARPDLHPRIDAGEAIVAAGARFGSGFDGTPSARLVVYAGRGAPTLAHEIVFSGTRADGTPTQMHYFVGASDGRILDQWDAIETGTGKTLYSGSVSLTTTAVTGGYELSDPSRGGNGTIDGHTGRNSGKIFKDADNIWGNFTNSDPASAAADAQFGVAATWDFYKNNFARYGIADNGKGSTNRVHYGFKYVNAFWSDSCFCMTYGDGDGSTFGPLVSLDITGHEMSHGVTGRTAMLAYSGESGGLNEATSDIMGTMVEFYANNASDTPDYLVGEETYIANVPGSASQKAMRYMFNPFKDGLSPNCYSVDIGTLDVHLSSGVANHFYYLLAEGSASKVFSGVDHASPTCNGLAVTGIGRTKAQQIWYRALTVYLTSFSGYANARAATISAATDLVGSYGITAADVTTVGKAWTAVGVN